MKKNLYIGGYSILDLNDTNVYKQALICAEQNKPVLVYDDPERYFADTIKIDTDNDDNVVITKGGKTITITDANSVSIVGDIQDKMIILDLSSYDLTNNVSDISGIGDANEITEETFTNLVNVVKKAQEENKPLFYKTSGLYDSQDIKGTFVAFNYELQNSLLIIPYVDIVDSATYYICIGKASDNKYYVFVSDNTWIR